MPRAHFITYALDIEGRPIPGPSVTVREPGTTTAITETIYAADTGGTTKTNPFTAPNSGAVEIYLDNPKVVDLFIVKTGFDDLTIRAHVSQLVPSTLVLKDAGTSMTQRAGINFEDGFVLADDAAQNETEIDLDYATTELVDVAATEAAGTSTKVPRADHVHGHGSGYLPDAHHARSHDHANASDGSALLPVTLTLPGAATPAQTAEGSVVWDTDDDLLTVGGGTGRKTFLPVIDGTSDPLAVAVDGAAADGTEATVARKSHVHQLVTSAAVPAAVASAGAAGTSGTAPSRGDHVHASAAIGGILFARKTVDESVTNSTVLQNDDVLLFAVGANETWEFELVATLVASSTINLKFDFALPSGGVGKGIYRYHEADTFHILSKSLGDITTDVAYLTSGSSDDILIVKAIYVGAGTAGTVNFRFANNTAGAGPTTIHAGSWIKATRVA